MPRVVIVGAGTGGTLAANRLQRHHGDAVDIVVIDPDDRHLYQPGLLFVPFGLADPQEIVRPRAAQLHSGIELRRTAVDHVDVVANTVHLESGEAIIYDVLVIASGTQLLPEETEGLTGPGWRERIFDFYTLDGATALRDALSSFNRGRLVVNVVDMPIKCPVAPLEFCFLTDWFLQRRGVRHDIDLTFATPLDGAFTKPIASAHLSELLAQKHIAVEAEFSTGQVDGDAGCLTSWDGREIAFDLLVTIPLHGGAPFIERSPGLGDELGFVFTDPHTLQSKAAPNIFAVGDATNVPTSKAGSVTHFEGETLVANIMRFLDGKPLEGSFDGHANCFVETGFNKALLIDFNYDHEPRPGRYPEPHVGPLPLLRESRLNHLAKLMFQSIYWHALLPGRDIPGIGARMHVPEGEHTA